MVQSMTSKWFRRLSRHHKEALDDNASIDFGDGVYYVVQQFCTELVAQRQRPEFNIKSLFEYNEGGLEHEINDRVFDWADPSIERLNMLAYATCTQCGGPVGPLDRGRCADCQRSIVFSPLVKWRRMRDARKAMRAVRLHDVDALRAAMTRGPWVHWMTISAYDDMQAIRTIAEVPAAIKAARDYMQSEFHGLPHDCAEWFNVRLAAGAALDAMGWDDRTVVRPL